MRIFFLIILLAPISLVAQVKYSSEAKKLYNKGIKEYKEGNETVALGLFMQCVGEDSRYAEAYLNMSSIYFSQKKHDLALASAKSAYHQNKFQAPIYTQLGKCYCENGQYDSAAFFLNKGVSLGDEGISNLIYLSNSQLKNEDYDGALQNLDKAIGLDEKNAGAYNARGKAKFQMADFEGAEADFNKALELSPKSTTLLVNLANCSVAQGKYEAAQEYINTGLNTVSKNERLQLLIIQGNVYTLQDSLELAIQSFDQAFEMDQSNVVVLNNQAAILLEMDDYESALTKCNQALDIQPEMMEAYFNRGIANEMLRNVEDACSDWEQAFILGSEKAEEFLNSATCNE